VITPRFGLLEPLASFTKPLISTAQPTSAFAAPPVMCPVDGPSC